MVVLQATSGTPESAFIKRLFKDLETKQVRYAVMRNHATLPESSAGSDLDILVAPDEMEAAKKVLLEAVKAENGKVIGLARTCNFFELYVIGISFGQWWGLCVELYSSLAYKSAMPIVDLDALYERFERHNNISVIPKDIGNTIGFIKEILSNGEPRKDKPQYQTSASFMLSHNWPLFQEVFRPLGLCGVRHLTNVLRGTTVLEITSSVRRLRLCLLATALAGNTFHFFYKRLRHDLFKVGRFIRPPGAVVAILGVDGVGKSTLIQSILPSLNAATHNAVFIQHLRPGWLPPLSLLKGQKGILAGPVVDPHGAIPSGFVGSLCRLAYLTLDYMFGYWLIVRPKIAKRPALIIFDRYAYDMALDPSRFRIGVSGRVAGWFAALAPKPDLIICLHGNPVTIAARKQELPLEETRRQVEALRDFASREPRAVMISTDTSVEDTRDQVLQALCDVLQSRSGIKH
ncbi:MAG: hypothetical protein V5B36_18180 [Candidatus Accumulibacter sp. UW25]|jgi:thymidylate kinase